MRIYYLPGTYHTPKKYYKQWRIHDFAKEVAPLGSVHVPILAKQLRKSRKIWSVYGTRL